MASIDTAATVPAAAPSRRDLFLQGPILPTLLRIAWPNSLMLMAQAAAGLVEAWWLSHLGTDALAGMAVVFPLVMLMQMMSAGAMGGGITSAIARALGAGRQADADALVLHALLVSLAMGAAFGAVMLGFGPAIYAALGAQGAGLQAALAYSDMVFGGIVLLWLMNGLASVIRGTGNMLVPALVVCGGALLLVPVSPLLIFGLGPLPGFGPAGAGAAMLLYFLGCAAVLGWYLLSGRNPARLQPVRLQRRLLAQILRVGLLASVSSVQTNLTVVAATALVGGSFGAAAVAGYGIAARLEYLLIPLVFGIGGTLVAMVGMNIGAGQGRRALRIALAGGLAACLVAEAVGLAAATWPEAWLRLFSDDPDMLAAGAAYMRNVGPFYGLFGLGFALYFACQGAGRLGWPLLAGFLRLAAVAGGGWLALALTGSLTWLFLSIGAGMAAYGLTILATTPALMRAASR
ncbi:MATE family efflux transporter [Marinibaculum pumilum]|uniref:MATE family efflux transporter n=1 Tax=Marinibaculum pumilum TaxID=1766165 RepID=A0ABV7LAM9_9PROT